MRVSRAQAESSKLSEMPRLMASNRLIRKKSLLSSESFYQRA